MMIRKNIFLFKVYYLLTDMWPLSVLAIVYFQQISGSYAFALGVFSIANIIQSIAEIPTGIISDKIGRRKTMILSSFLTVIAFLLFAVAGTLGIQYLLMLGGVIWAIADAFASGTDEAMMYETMEELRQSNKYDILYARTKTFGQIGMGLGALIAAFITYFYSLIVLAWLSAVLSIGRIWVTLQLIEPKVHSQEELTSLQHFISAIKAFMKNKKLRTLASIQMLNRGISFTSHRLEGAYFNMLIPTWAVNIARITKQVCGVISYSIAPYFRKFGFYKVLLVSTIGMTIIKLAAVILNNFATPFIQSSVNTLYGISSTAESALLQEELSSKQRATMGSIVALLGGVLSAIIYWFVGLIADMSSVYFAILALILCNVFVSAGYYWMLKKYK